MPASKKQFANASTDQGPAVGVTDLADKSPEDAATVPAPEATAATAEPVAMEEDDAAAPSIGLKPVVNHTQAAIPGATQAGATASTQAWPAAMTQPAALGANTAKPVGFNTGRAPPSSKPSSRVQQRRTRGRGPQAAAAPADLQWQPESLECVGESSDPAEGHKQQRAGPSKSHTAGAAATAAAPEQDEPADPGNTDAAADDEPAPISVIAKATAAGARARQQQQQQQRQAGVSVQPPPQWQQQQWQMRDSRISAGSSTTCNICASDSGGSSSSGSVTGPFAGGYTDEASSQVNQEHRVAAAAGIERLGIGSTAAKR